MATNTDDEDAAQVLDAHGAALPPLLPLAAGAAPPLLLQHVQPAVLQDAQDGDGHLVPVGGSWNPRQG